MFLIQIIQDHQTLMMQTFFSLFKKLCHLVVLNLVELSGENHRKSTPKCINLNRNGVVTCNKVSLKKILKTITLLQNLLISVTKQVPGQVFVLKLNLKCNNAKEMGHTKLKAVVPRSRRYNLLCRQTQ